MRGTPGKHSIKWSGTGIIPACAGNTTRTRTCPDGALWIIPACAGNTWRRARQCETYRDHPRVCGEHRHGSRGHAFHMGSSPRVRGTPGTRHPLWHHPGIIPACAGNTFRSSRVAEWRGDHPRVCGEHGGCDWRTSGRTGSSPRVRGTQIPTVGLRIAHGIIPACAGNTMRGGVKLDTVRDHPRVCGEHTGTRNERTYRQGSSPRARGTHGWV